MTTTLQIRIDKKTKDSARKAFHALGLDMSSGVKIYLNQVAQTKSIPFPVMSADYWPLEKKLQVIKEAEYALKHGKSYHSARELHAAILRGEED